MADLQSKLSPSSPPFSPPQQQQQLQQQPQQRERSGTTMSIGNLPTASENGATVANGNGAAPAAANTDVSKQVQDVLSSDIAVAAMLNRLKQSIAAAKEFALFLKKRSILEEDHAQGLKKLCRMTQESIRRPEHKQGTFAQAYDEMMFIHDRMAENGIQFSLSLHQMSEDLLELAAIAERNRKGWKTNGLASEQRVAEIEAAMRKSKTKYDSLAEEYERAKTGDTSRQSGKMFGVKGPKSGAQYEEDLLRKVQGADQDYHGRVQALQAEKAELVSRTRPEAVKALQDLVKETDSGVSLQMQKFASFNEKLLLSNGISISPLKTPGAEQTPRSLREAVASINNEKDLSDYLISHHSRLPAHGGEVKYERHPALNPQPAFGQAQNISMPQMGQMSPPGQFPVQHPPPGQIQPGSRTGSGFTSPTGSPGAQGPVPQGFNPVAPGIQAQMPVSSQQTHGRNFSTSALMSHTAPPPTQQGGNRASAGPAPRFSGPNLSQGPPQLGALPFQVSQPQQPQGLSQQRPGQFNPLQQNPTSQQMAAPVQPQSAAPIRTQQSPPPQLSQVVAQPAAASSKPVFGISLAKLYERDGLAVPMVVYQCIQAVDLFGLGLEGIYRQSGSMNHIVKLKNMFDTDSANPVLDFRNPENFYHDVNSVTGLLKQFFRDLPDPLLTMEHHAEFIEAAKHEDDTLRRDSLHAIINSLPDPNYATLRALTLHLYRVMDNSHVTRMNSHNLGVIFGPTLMGSDPTTGIADAGWQIRVVDTILQNTYQIFDED